MTVDLLTPEPHAAPEGDAALIGNYLATGLLTVALAILAARMLDRLWPALFGILSGGREGFTGRPRLSVLGQTGG